MPSIKIFNNGGLNNSCKELEYENETEKLESIISKYDPYMNSQNTRLAIGDSLFMEWNLPIDLCLFYGETITLYNHTVNLNVYFGDKHKIIQVELSNTVEYFEFKIKTQFDIIMSTFKLKFHNTFLDGRFKTLDSYDLINNSSVYVTDYIVSKEQNLQIEIFVKTLSGKDIQFHCYEHATIISIKNQIQEKEGVPPDQQRLLYSGSLLLDECTLKHYKILDQTRLYLILKLRGGGGSFADLTQQPSSFEWSKTGPKWRIAKMGLCLEGKCINTWCKAFNRTVIINMGVPIIFKLGLPTIDKPTNCPICDEYVEPLTCAFNNCQYRYLSVEDANDGVKKIKSDWVQVENTYNRFDESKQISYKSLVIETKAGSKYSNYVNSDGLTKKVDCQHCLSSHESGDNSSNIMHICKVNNMNKLVL